eukprot:scaffold647832_cov41-Prasinocladus_malaysianus.AAC.1
MACNISTQNAADSRAGATRQIVGTNAVVKRAYLLGLFQMGIVVFFLESCGAVSLCSLFWQ